MAEKKRKRGEPEIRKDEGTRRNEEEKNLVPPGEETVTAKENLAPSAVKDQPKQPDASGDHEKRRSIMADEMRTETAASDYRGMAKAWKDGYLQGLDACLKWQEENERLLKDSFKQGLSGSRQLLTWWKDWVETQTQRQAEAQKQINTNPFLGFTKQSADAMLATVEPLLKNSEAAVESTFGCYESALATPSRKYVREINQQVLDVVIPA
jgi:hypothetical protein